VEVVRNTKNVVAGKLSHIMIVTAGQLRGRKIICSPGKNIRPTSSRVRQAVFNSLFSMDINMKALKVLDLFAGTGIMSFESISRGAICSLLVDNSREAIKLIQDNSEKLGISESIKVLNSDVMSFIDRNSLKDFGLILMDPPYAYTEYKDLVSKILNSAEDKTFLLVESNKKTAIELSKVFNDKLLKTKNWGDTFVSFFRN
jgi:16S rRNA (guanine966-N2)-methyltransferase